MEIRIEEYKDFSIMNSMWQDWSSLCDMSTGITPFQYPHWLVPWWKIFGSSEFRSIALYSNSQLIAFLPFYLFTDNENKKNICLLGNGISDYLDFAVIDKFKIDCIDKIRRYFADINNEWDILKFDDVNEQSNLMMLIMNQQWKVVTKQHHYSFYKYIKPDTPFIHQLPKQLRHRIKTDIFRLYKAGYYSFEECNESEYKNNMEQLFIIHEKCWLSKEMNGVFNTPQIKEFHRGAVKNLISNGMLSFYSLRFKESAIAMYYVIKKGTTAFIYIGGYEPSMKYYSPGTIALYFTIDSLRKKGFSKVDFLRGEEEYKKHWKPADSNNYSVEIIKEN
jgi:CelD/BcsL family acetyltransferase involved in cellulose biosynthesis